ncbi:ABC transporter ATP-binding protein [Actinobacteria bacterium YIM 96077]|uniref:ABC transporter ATP-binding protein n=1 Tax=Phytoactinopolyspora halophila TaxID=1981511 RepID=A0A329R3X3_9ACTN|nr:ABC transporter ATP-binding protein [Phytoactinopolyspora halophila]AYY12017.1 ABC transporter ATP-binding protein [Actinobacteria bacterium YIM 96077]RAW18749.1 ABC transporter ATP-binding protein [Phytoactinopolyspora halophila]
MGTLKVQGLRKKYGKTTAVDGVDLAVENGEFFVVLGPSGAGKTTTLKCIAGLLEFDDGWIEIAGRNMSGVEPYHRNVAMAFESYALYPQKTVFENLASPLRSGRTGRYGAEERRRRIQTVTDTLGISHLWERFPRELSNGQRQRVALGRVLVRPADVYLLDEPLSHLDAKLRAAMRAELKQLGELADITTLYVTHDYQEALALGDRVAVLRDGRIVQVDTPEQVWHQPVDTFVARALGQPEMNLLDGRVDGGRIRVAGGTVSIPVPPALGVQQRQAVRVGLRPRDISTGADPGAEPPGRLRMRGTVRLAERLGRSVEMSVDVAGTPVIVVVSSDNARPEGDEVDLDIALEHVHVFAGGEPDVDTPRLGAAGIELGKQA